MQSRVMGGQQGDAVTVGRHAATRVAWTDGIARIQSWFFMNSHGHLIEIQYSRQRERRQSAEGVQVEAERVLARIVAQL
jgi:hypothetical protein